MKERIILGFVSITTIYFILRYYIALKTEILTLSTSQLLFASLLVGIIYLVFFYEFYKQCNKMVIAITTIAWIAIIGVIEKITLICFIGIGTHEVLNAFTTINLLYYCFIPIVAKLQNSMIFKKHNKFLF